MKINMNKIKLIFIQILLFSLITISNSFGKALPPGSGVADVPANVLILLDKSGSMGWRMQSAASLYHPRKIAVDSSGDVYVMQNYNYGMKKFIYDTNIFYSQRVIL